MHTRDVETLVRAGAGRACLVEIECIVPGVDQLLNVAPNANVVKDEIAATLAQAIRMRTGSPLMRWSICTGLLLVATCSCAPRTPSTPSVSSPESVSQKASIKYVPLLFAGAPPVAYVKGSLGADVWWAAAAETLVDAKHRWQQVIERHTPLGGEYEDGFQVRHLRGARMELTRILFLLGESNQADQQMIELFEESGN